MSYCWQNRHHIIPHLSHINEQKQEYMLGQGAREKKIKFGVFKGGKFLAPTVSYSSPSWPGHHTPHTHWASWWCGGDEERRVGALQAHVVELVEAVAGRAIHEHGGALGMGWSLRCVGSGLVAAVRWECEEIGMGCVGNGVRWEWAAVPSSSPIVRRSVFEGSSTDGVV